MPTPSVCQMVTKTAKSMTKKLHSVSNFAYERAAWAQKSVVCGVDEAGCGCLAGPVVAAAVILRPGAVIDGVKDSKLVPKELLPELAHKIISQSWYGIGISSPYLIDSCNIRGASLRAMGRALGNLFAICPIIPSKVLVDALPLGNFLGTLGPEFISAPKGEYWSYSIAAASIVAKVKRDQIMTAYGEIYPKLDFGKHKGYATKAHQSNIIDYGQSVVHRNTYLKKLFLKEHQCKLF